jgi:hypothetical protein
MDTEQHNPGTESGRVLPFRVRPDGAPASRQDARPASSTPSPPPEDLGRYERNGTGADDYRHRMTANFIAFLFCILLVVAGMWLAGKIAELRRDQDCVLSGRRNCAQPWIGNPRS